MHEYMQKKSEDKKQNSQQMKHSVVQRLRLRLNDDIEDNNQFDRLRQVPVSHPDHAAVSNTPASNKLQKHYTPHVAEATLWDKLSALFENQYSDYGPLGSVSTLDEFEDIILEGHGTDVGMENYAPRKIAEIAKKIIHTCGYNAAVPWQGKLVLLGCETGQYVLDTARSLRAKVGFPVTVVGTERKIRVNEEAGGVHYAEEDWAGTDEAAPINLTEIVYFDNFLNHALSPSIEQIEFVLKEFNNLIIGELRAQFDPNTASTPFLRPQFRTQFDLIYGQFANVRVNFTGITVPAQPADIQFPAGNLPAIQTHYTQAAVGDCIPIAPGLNANTISTNVINSLNALDTAYGQFLINGYTIQNINTFCTAFNPICYNITNEYRNVQALISEFRRAKSRRINFDGPHVTQILYT